MKVDFSTLTVEEALRMAIQAEIDSAKVYKKLGKLVKNFVMKDKLKFLQKEEKNHQQIVEALFAKMFPNRSPGSSDKSLVPRLQLALDENTTVPDLLELAMEAEKTAEEFYDFMSQEVEERGAQEILQYLSSMEHGHYALLKGEYELCMNDEQYYQRDDFQYDMVHVGP